MSLLQIRLGRKIKKLDYQILFWYALATIHSILNRKVFIISGTYHAIVFIECKHALRWALQQSNSPEETRTTEELSCMHSCSIASRGGTPQQK